MVFGMDPTLVAQTFRQLFYYICAIAMNQLLLRKDLCHWTKGIQIRYNVSQLEHWVRSQHINVQESGLSATDSLQPIIEAAQLLQANKSNDDVEILCSMCSRLTSAQVVKLLNMYTPLDDLEECVSRSFIRNVENQLKKRKALNEDKMLMDVKLAFAVRFPYSPSPLKLEDIDIPSVLNLPILNKI